MYVDCSITFFILMHGYAFHIIHLLLLKKYPGYIKILIANINQNMNGTNSMAEVNGFFY